ncbi:spermidine/putrescine transport system permease protein [Clostridium cavendishii DSM 21758]|uniref:Spermidine/putrescine transport system permease protein n=1 Tax=Clostridium cavendishii DSM 21758 TaxID=1121302 RepID=A0A1M6AGK4_9CLOT|nr:ABC transporter permease [Clostridium cavendishii]SHI35654.1 spermidine/putrescine transport system permease protein [Clostridium cavendishii DSM 21758]
MNKKRNISTYPYIVWSSLFIVIPLLIVLFFSFTQKVDNSFVFSLENYKRLFHPLYLKVFGRSLYLALTSTIICLVLGYPVAYIISKYPIKKRNALILLFILPMWMNFLLRTYAWMAILGKNGFINTVLNTIGLPTLNLLYNDAAIMLGMVYNFLPFMVIPIYTVLIKIDKDLINAAYDLGAKRNYVFRKVIFPLSMPGVMSGITMVFMPAVSTFVISRLLGGGQYMLIGNLIEQQFTNTGDWNFGSSLSIFMMFIIIISMALMSRYDKDSKREGSE